MTTNAFKISRAALFAFGVALHALFMSTGAHADDWHYGVGVSGVYYPRTQDDVWYEATHKNVRTFRNFALDVDAEKQISKHLRVEIGVFAPQAQYVNANVVSDNAYFAGKWGPEGTLLTVTKTVGIYAKLSPEYRGFFLDLGAWVFRQSVEAQAWGPNGQPASVMGWPSGVNVGSVGYAIDPVYGFGYRFGTNSVSVDWFGIATGPKNSIGHCVACQSGPHSMLPPGMSRIVAAKFEHTF